MINDYECYIVEIKYTYDPIADALSIHVVDDAEYDKTISFNNNILLDFDKNDRPVALEILDARKLLNVNIRSLKRIVSIDLQVEVNDKEIIVKCNLQVPIDGGNQLRSNDYTIDNYMNLPPMKIELVTA